MLNFKKIYILLLVAIFIMFFANVYLYFYNGSLPYLLKSSIFLLIFCILYTFINIKIHILSCIFYIMIFIFLLSLPVIDYFKTGSFIWYEQYVYAFSIKIIMISIIAIFIGSFLGEYYYKNKNIKQKVYSKEYLKSIRVVSMMVFLLSYPSYVILNIEKAMYKIKVGDYYTYYSTFQSQLPKIIDYISTFTVYSFIIYLATKPKKIYATLVLMMYIFSNALILLTGTRNPFILSVLFAFVYYFLRNQEEKGLWIGIKEKIIIYVLSIPIVIIMGVINYTRDGESVDRLSLLDILIDFIYKQGTSFNVVAQGYIYNISLPVREFRSYTFGSIYHSSISNLLFNTPSIASLDRIEMAKKSNSLAHNLSYLVFPESYLAGHGVGDNYIIGNYIDYGIWGVFIISLILGFIFIFMTYKIYFGNMLISTIILTILLSIFFTPRGGFSESFSFLFSYSFWINYVVIQLLTNLIKKNNKYLL